MSLNWDYDRYGNRWHQNLTAGSGYSVTTSFDTSSNRDVQSLAYYASGDVHTDTLHTYQYDNDNRILQVDGGLEYIYDAEGRRVGKPNGTVYVVGVGGNVLDEFDNGVWKRSEVDAGGKHLATVTSGGVYFTHADWLGTERGRTNLAGQVCEMQANLPYGESVAAPALQQGVAACNPSPAFFTGKERDPETGLDDFGARYLSSHWGHWMSPDWSGTPVGVPYAHLENPQSLNLYAYVGGDPINGEDADGHSNYISGDAATGYVASYPSSSNPYTRGSGFLTDSVGSHDPVRDHMFSLVLIAAEGGPSDADEPDPVQDATAPASAPPKEQQNMSVSQQGQDFIKGYEKLSLTVYDANPPHGDWTIGYGHKVASGDFAPISKEQAESFFSQDVSRMADHVNGDLKVGVTQNQFDALVSLRFNAGANAVTPPVRDLNSDGCFSHPLPPTERRFCRCTPCDSIYSSFA